MDEAGNEIMFPKILLPIDADLVARLKLRVRDIFVVEGEVRASLRKSANAPGQQLPQITTEPPSVEDSEADDGDLSSDDLI